MRVQVGLNEVLQAGQVVDRVLASNGRLQADLSARIAAGQARSARLTEERARLESDEALAATRVEADRQALKLLARQLYAQPDTIGGALSQAQDPADFFQRLTELWSVTSRVTSSTNRAIQRLTEIRSQLRANDEFRREAEADTTRAQTDLDATRAAAQVLRGVRAGLDEEEKVLRDGLEKVKKSARPEDADRLADSLEAPRMKALQTAMTTVWDQARGWDPNLASTLVGAASGDRFGLPVLGAVVTQGFGPSDFWIEPAYAGFPHFHTGIDFAAPAGTPVLAAQSGVILQAIRSDYGYGNYLVVSHPNGTATLYGHLLDFGARVGDQVSKGQVIGLVGSTGASTGPHLHFEVRIGGAPLDPLAFLGGQPGSPSPGPGPPRS